LLIFDFEEPQPPSAILVLLTKMEIRIGKESAKNLDPEGIM
jgi:hypothetical protein